MNRITVEIPKYNDLPVNTDSDILSVVTQDNSIIIKLPLYDLEVVVVMKDELRYAKHVACTILSVTPEKLNRSKSERAVWARWLVWEYAFKVCNYSYPKCGKLFLKYDKQTYAHSTVMSAMKALSGNRHLQWQTDAYNKFWEQINKYEKSLKEE